MTMPATAKGVRFGGLSTKLIIAFTLVFTLVFSAAYFWFLTSSVNIAKEAAITDLVGMLRGIAAGVNGDDFQGLIQEGQPRDDGYTDDPRYWTLAHHLADTKTYELGRTGIYSFTFGDEPNQVHYVASAGSLLTPPVGVKFMQVGTDSQLLNPGDSNPLHLIDNITALSNECWISSGAIPESVLASLTAANADCVTIDVGPDRGFFSALRPEWGYTDGFGSWITGNYPIRNSTGEIVGGVSMDYYAPYVNQVRERILNSALVAFAITYVVLFVLVFALSRALTRPLRRLSEAAAQIGEGHYDVAEKLAEQIGSSSENGWKDEISVLSLRLLDMTKKIDTRETKLKAEVQQLRIEIDEARVAKQVSEVVETDFFEHLSNRVKEMRSRKENPGGTDPASGTTS